MSFEQTQLFHDESEQVSQQRAPGDLNDYQRVLVFFSGGKDSIACVLHLLELGIPAEKIELHHHLIDGREGSDLMDWPVTEAYCQAFADAFGMEMTWSWKQGGLEREMLREKQPTAPMLVPGANGIVTVGGEGPLGTRRKFPQLAASLNTRWCSSYLKIGVGAAYIVHHPKFAQGRTLVVTGERAQESSARAKYLQFEPHRTDNRCGTRARRWLDHWRPVHAWPEEQVWAIIERHKVNPHPAYRLGWGRVSCMCCVFGSRHQWASIKSLAPQKFIRIANYESEFGCTIHRSLSVEQQAASGTPYDMPEGLRSLAMSATYDEPIIVDDWQLPAGAYGEACGPT